MFRRRTSLTFLFVLLTALWGFAAVRPAHAAIVTVTNTNDTGAGSFRNQVAAAIAGDTIAFALPANSTITLTSGEITINKNLIINGASATNLTISGGNTSRILNITAGTIIINDLTLTNANAAGLGGGAIRTTSTGNLTLNRVNLTNSTALDGAGIFMGANSIVTLNRSTVSGNTTTDDGGGINNEGGSLTISHSTISGNSAASGGSNRGGGIVVYQNGTAAITYSTITNNQSGDGGGITIANSAGTGTVAVSASIIFGNRDVNGTATVEDNCSFIAGGTITDNGYNLSAVGTGCAGLITTNAVTTNPSLAALADNGANTNTHAITGASSAANVIPQGTLGCVQNSPNGTGLTDQRGAVRAGQNSAGGNYGGGLLCDIGAFEFNSAVQCSGGACTPTAVTLSQTRTHTNTTAVPLLLITAFCLLWASTTIAIKKINK